MNKILFTSHNSLTDPLAEGLSRWGSVTVLHSNTRNIPNLKGARVRSISYKHFGLPALMRFLKSEISIPSYIKDFGNIMGEEKPDIVVTFDFHKFVFWQCVRYKKKNPHTKLFLYSETKYWPRNILARFGMRFFWWYLKKNLTHIEKIIVFTREGKKFFEGRLHNINIELCPAPVDTEVFYPNEAKQFLKDGVLRICMVARYVPYKKHKDLIDAAALLKKRGTGLHISFLGNGGHFKDEIKKYVEKRSVLSEVSFLERMPRNKMRDMYTSHDILVLPSLDEAVGMVVPEAMACGLPTITSDTAGANVYVREGETGLIFKTGDVEDLAEKILYLHEEEKLKEMGTHARRTIENNFSREKIVSHFKNILELTK